MCTTDTYNIPQLRQIFAMLSASAVEGAEKVTKVIDAFRVHQCKFESMLLSDLLVQDKATINLSSPLTLRLEQRFTSKCIYVVNSSLCLTKRYIGSGWKSL